MTDDVADLAHRLRTPLAIIIGYAELLRVRSDDRTLQEAPHRILEAAQRLSGELDAVFGVSVPPVARNEAAGPRPLALGRRRIVVVDDDPLVRSLLRLTLPPGEFVVEEANSGNEALAAVEEEQPALVLLDWRMPGVSGADVLGQLKRRWPSVCVVVVTGETDPVIRDEATQLGADEFLTKPFSPIELLSVVERLLAIGDYRAA